jgi:hypothetical protein
MKRTLSLLSVTVCALAIAIACSKQSSQPSAPSTVDPSMVGANSDGSTLKVTAPTPQSPINGVRLQQGEPVVLTFANSTAMFVADVPLTYRIEVMNASGANVETELVAGGPNSTSRAVDAALEGEQMYQWRVRAEYAGLAGPWSSIQSFIAPPNDGYIRGNELYDPLINGRTVGEIHGPVRFIPGVGVQLLTWDSYISYQLPQTLTEGEYSLLVTNMAANTEGEKQKVMAMSQGYADLITNDRRMTVEKRGDPSGTIAWRFITHDDQVDTVGNERRGFPFQASEVYFFQVTWRNNFFNLAINEGGVNGRNIYDFGKSWGGRQYDPNPHVIFVGAPIGRSGSAAASIENTIYRQIWVSNSPRPAYANQ